jgi:hypothetical protein
MTSILENDAPATHLVDSDPVSFTRFAVDQGWGDGLPLIPPTEARVQPYLDALGLPADHVIARLGPLQGDCTVLKLATNAMMTAAPPEAMPLLRSAVEAVGDPAFELLQLNATTAPVVPALLVNGPVRHLLKISFGAGCLGGADGNTPSIGRALRLVLRNVAGARIGLTSQSVHGQPGRISGVVFGEWEERSPWAPFAERQAGVSGDAVTAFGSMGSMNIIDAVADTPAMLLDHIGRSLAYHGANGYVVGLPVNETMVAINPIWAGILGKEYLDVADVQERIWHAASTPLSEWADKYQRRFEEYGRVRDGGRVYLVSDPSQILVVVAGGLGGLHAAGLHGIGSSRATTRSITGA